MEPLAFSTHTPDLSDHRRTAGSGLLLRVELVEQGRLVEAGELERPGQVGRHLSGGPVSFGRPELRPCSSSCSKRINKGFLVLFSRETQVRSLTELVLGGKGFFF